MASSSHKASAWLIVRLCGGLALLCQACVGPTPEPARSALLLQEKMERFVRVEARSEDPRWDGVARFSHPLHLSPAEWTRLLSSIRIQSRKDSVYFTLAMDPPTEAFAPEEIGYLSHTLSDIFAKAAPDEWVSFGMSRVLPSGVNEITTGGLFVTGPRLHLILANYRHSVSKSAVREQLRTAPLRTQAAPFYEVVEGEHQTVVRDAGLFQRLLRSAGPEIVIEYEALLAARPIVGAPSLAPTLPPVASPTESSRLPVATIEERLQDLKRLRDQGLITEEEYRQKKKEVLDRF
ncbi:MAG TPA: SHOCT domain-containing protein [Nitrospiraceae bacterium]|nr:SHOCT domain-containing protein [Nitrospiraceae bacterium]